MLQGKIKIHKEEEKYTTYTPPINNNVIPFISEERKKVYNDDLDFARKTGYLPGRKVLITNSKQEGTITYLENNVNSVRWVSNKPLIIRVINIGPNNSTDYYHFSEMTLITPEDPK